MGSEMDVKSAKKVKKLKARVTDMETSISSWETRLMEIDQQHQNMFSQYSKKICKLTRELEDVRTKFKSSNRRIRELEDKIMMLGQGQAALETPNCSTAEEVPNSPADSFDRNRSFENGLGESRSCSMEYNNNKMEGENNADNQMDNDVVVELLRIDQNSHETSRNNVEAMEKTSKESSVEIVESSPEKKLIVAAATPRTSTRLKKKRELRSMSPAYFHHAKNTESTSNLASGSDIVVDINPDSVYIEEASLPEEEDEEEGQQASDRNSHWETIIEAKPFACHECHIIFTAREDLDLHFNSSHGLPYKCHLCPKKFGLDIGLEAHLEKAHDVSFEKTSTVQQGSKRVECSICHVTFGSNWAMKKHVENVHGRGKERSYFECDFCDRKCMTRDSLSAHVMLIHHGVKPFTCSSCHKSFTRRAHLIGHKCPILVDGKPTCPKCYKTFPTWKQVSGHLTKHRKKLSYNRKPNQKIRSQMIKVLKENNRATHCLICTFQYATVASFRRHLRRAHPGVLRQAGLANSSANSN